MVHPEAEEDVVGRGDHVVDPEAALVALDPVVLAHEVVPERVARREVGQGRPCSGASIRTGPSDRRDDVVRERLCCRRSRIVDHGAGQQGREVAAPERLLRHVRERLGHLADGLALVVEEEERPVGAQGAAERETKLVLLQRSLLGIDGVLK